MKGLISLGRIDELKYSTVILVLLLHVFGPWETRMHNVCLSTESQVFMFIGWAFHTQTLKDSFPLKAEKRSWEKGSTFSKKNPFGWHVIGECTKESPKCYSIYYSF